MEEVRKIIIIMLLFLTLNSFAQKHEAVKIISIYSGSIILDAVGDGLNDSGHKDWGHLCNAGSIGVLLTSPFIIDYEKSKWGWYFASYIGLRIGLFDYAYNETRGLGLNYIGCTSNWDKIMRKLNPPNTYLGRAVFLTVGIAIPINDIDKKKQ
jgi:hypothetical protein